MCDKPDWVDAKKIMPPFGVTVWIYDKIHGKVMIGWTVFCYGKESAVSQKWVSYDFGTSVDVTAWKHICRPGFPPRELMR